MILLLNSPHYSQKWLQKPHKMKKKIETEEVKEIQMEEVIAIVSKPFAFQGKHRMVGTEMNLKKEDYESLSEYLLLKK